MSDQRDRDSNSGNGNGKSEADKEEERRHNDQLRRLFDSLDETKKYWRDMRWLGYMIGGMAAFAGAVWWLWMVIHRGFGAP